MMIVVNIILGLIGLGIVVLVHEIGHFVTAKASGVTVEAFSIGWGKELVGITRGETRYRISMIPIGGYCKMKGEHDLQESMAGKKTKITGTPGSYFYASPWKRILIAFSGPAMNIIFSAIVLTVVWTVGFSIQTFENRIIMASDYPALTAETETYPADRAGLQTGDRIISVNGDDTDNFRALQEKIALSAKETIRLTVLRNGNRIETTITPKLDTETGAGYIGIYPWVEPIVAEVTPDSPAASAGLEAGDVIISADGTEITNSLDFYLVAERIGDTFSVAFRRDGVRRETEIIPQYDEEGSPVFGITFQHITVTAGQYGIFRGIGKGFTETFRTLGIIIKSIGLLFKGVDLTNAVAGPIRITYMVGEVASEGFKLGFGKGLSAMFNFLSLLSVSLFFMNLLPIPALDGGQIILFTFEWITGKPLRPKLVYRYQYIGVILVILLLVLAVFSDAFFILGR
ncbi:MAG: RIP metalloprotease RseP [Spirochaetia bacterium]